MKFVASPPKPKKPIEPKEEIEKTDLLYDIICDYLIAGGPAKNFSEFVSRIIEDYPNALIELTKEHDILLYYKMKILKKCMRNI